jgi:anaerobic magnesium-protoporphyrin IX monomethyl ester cyclase
MKVLLVNPPLQNLSNRIGVGFHLPLGLLMVGGPLVDDGHEVELLDADALMLSVAQTAREVVARRPHVLMVGHSGSVSANPVSLRLFAAVKGLSPDVVTVYGGLYPTFAHWDLIANHRPVDIVARGEGEEVGRRVVAALEGGMATLDSVAGITWRSAGSDVVANPSQHLIENLDDYRVGWELADWSLYRGFGFPGSMAGVQFSRGCDHVCTYCGQRPFWGRWRHRSIESFTADLELLHREHGVRSIWIADENWGADREEFLGVLTAIADLPFRLEIFCSLCAADVVRDADALDLYRRAGIRFVLMGIESDDEEILRRIRKDNPHEVACRAISLLREHGILSVANYVYGLRPETAGTMFRTLRRIRQADPDFLNALYLCPHGWTQEGRRTPAADIIQPDQQRWTYRCQVLRSPSLSPWAMFLWVKMTKMAVQLRWRWFWRIFSHPDREVRRLLRWCFPRITAVWLAEILDFLFRTTFAKPGSLPETLVTELLPGAHEREPNEKHRRVGRVFEVPPVR